MPTWSIEPIADTPETILESWGVFDVPLDGPDQPWTRYFVGYARPECQGQVSPAVETFDCKTRCGITRSGRTYRLAGHPGGDADARNLWTKWKQMVGVTEEREVTQELFAQMLSS